MTEDVSEERTEERPTGLPAGDGVAAEVPFYHEDAPQAFQRLWTPHRMVYIGGQNRPTDDTPDQCPFCTGPTRSDEEALIVHRGETSYVIMNLYPYNTGHLLVCPYRHISDWTEATAAEREEIGRLTATAMSVVRSVSHPHGFNLGMNQGESPERESPPTSTSTSCRAGRGTRTSCPSSVGPSPCPSCSGSSGTCSPPPGPPGPGRAGTDPPGPS